MLKIICGEDSLASRNCLIQLISDWKSKNYLTENITATDLKEISKIIGSEISLFSQTKIYIISNLSCYYQKKKKTDSHTKIIEKIAVSKNILLIDWEDGIPAYKLAALKSLTSDFKEFRPAKTIFQLLESCYPQNRRTFLENLDKVSKTQNEAFIFRMICNHLRLLIIVKNNKLSNTIPAWQKKKLQLQARLWPLEALIDFYVGLAKIDTALKSGSTPFSLKRSLDIIACYYL